MIVGDALFRLNPKPDFLAMNDCFPWGVDSKVHLATFDLQDFYLDRVLDDDRLPGPPREYQHCQILHAIQQACDNSDTKAWLRETL